MLAWAYRALAAVLLPAAFRREWGEDMVDEARLQWAEARASGRRWVTARRLVLDLVGSGLREWKADGATARRRDSRRGVGMRTDVKVAWRGIRRSPGYSGAVVATLALGVGSVALVFSMVDAFLLRSLPYPEPERLVSLWSETNWSRDMVARARSELDGVEVASGYGGVLLVLDEGGEPVGVFAGRVTAGHLEQLGGRPALGRLFDRGDEAAGAEPVTILSHAVWVDRFASDPAIVGRTISLGGLGTESRTVVGVLPADFSSLMGTGVEAWVPVTFDPSQDDYRNSYFMSAIGRLPPGGGLDAVRDEMAVLAERLAADNAGGFSEREIRQASVRTLRDEVGRDRRTPLLLALGAAALVLLVACANVANLVLARTVGRRSELSVRAALGSGRTRAARGVLVEVGALGLTGGGLGLIGAVLAAGALARRAPDLVPAGGAELSPRVIVVSLAVVVLAALLAGVLPALRAAGRDPAGSLSSTRGGSDDRGVAGLQRGLAAVQMAIALVGVASAGLLGRSLLALTDVDPGFAPEGLVSFRITAPPAEYATDAEILDFHLGVRDALEATPGVESAGLVNRLPMGRGRSRISVFPEGFEPPESGEIPEVTHRLVTAGYLETLGARLRDGALPGVDDERAEGVPFGVLNQAAADRFWPGESAVGKRFLGPGGVVWLQVVGVVDDVREQGIGRPTEEPAVYIPLRDWPWRTTYAVVRARAGVEASQLKEAVWSVSPGVPVNNIRPVAELVAETVRPTRLLAWLAATVGLVTLLLGGVGVYGVASYGSSRRRREHGIRAALGADRSTLLRDELRRAAHTVLWGGALGLSGAWLAGRALESVLFGVTARDPLVLAAASTLLLLAGLAAAWLPARRAATTDPAGALRAD